MIALPETGNRDVPLEPGKNRMSTTAKRPLVHSVYFSLKDPTPANIQALVDACHKYLKGEPGEVAFAAGPLVEELNRPVNVRDFHVGLCVIFDSGKAQDDYQTAPRHLKFIEENKPTWASVRVFDSWGA